MADRNVVLHLILPGAAREPKLLCGHALKQSDGHAWLLYPSSLERMLKDTTWFKYAPCSECFLLSLNHDYSNTLKHKSRE